jgi:hypothetical protein
MNYSRGLEALLRGAQDVRRCFPDILDSDLPDPTYSGVFLKVGS